MSQLTAVPAPYIFVVLQGIMRPNPKHNLRASIISFASRRNAAADEILRTVVAICHGVDPELSASLAITLRMPQAAAYAEAAGNEPLMMALRMLVHLARDIDQPSFDNVLSCIRQISRYADLQRPRSGRSLQ